MSLTLKMFLMDRVLSYLYLNFDMQTLSDANAELEEKLKDVRTDLQDSAVEMDRMTEEYTKLKMVLQQTDRIVEEMRKERDVLRAQVQITDY